MGYTYATQKEELFTESGVKCLLRIRDKVHVLLSTSGAFTAGKAMVSCTGSSWNMLAALDFLVESGEIKCITLSEDIWAQDRVYISNRRNGD